jgi:pseudoazurin
MKRLRRKSTPRTELKMTKCGLVALCIAGAIGIATPATAADFQVKMLNKGTDGQIMVFGPPFLHIQPGDTVRFIAADKGHDAETIPGMLPEGAQPFKGKLSQDVSVTFQTPGLYGYRCIPHFGMGMVGLIEVGDNTSNLASARQVKMPPLPTKRMATLFEQATQHASAQPGLTPAAR